jgi:hypothetical protein
MRMPSRRLLARVCRPARPRRAGNDRRGTSLCELPMGPDQEKVAFGYRVTWPPDKKVRYFELSPEQIMQQALCY